MARQVTCRFCNHTLRVAEDAPPGPLTCPLCLSEIEQPQQPPASTRETPREITGPTTCRWCESPVEPAWNFCPKCQGALRAVRQPRRYRHADDDIGEDTKKTRWGLIAMGVLGGLVAVNSLFAAVAAASETYGSVEPLISLLIVFAIIAGVVFVVRLGRGKSANVWKVIGGSFVAIGVISCTGLVVAGAIFAFLFVVCMSKGFKL